MHHTQERPRCARGFVSRCHTVRVKALQNSGRPNTCSRHLLAEQEVEVITEQELASIERKLNALVTEANDSGGLSLAENANWAVSALARVCEEVRELRRARWPEGHDSPRGVCRCALCKGDYRVASALG